MSLEWILQKSKLKPAITIIYGPSGLGKTTLAVGSKNPVVLQTEDGLGILTNNRKIPHSGLIKTYDEFMDKLRDIYKLDKGTFDTLVIDSLDHLEPLIHAKTCEVHKQPSLESFGYGRGYKEAMKYFREFLDAVQRLRNDKGMRVIMIAHNQIKTFHDPLTEPYDRHEMKLHKDASALVLETCDMCLFLNYKKGTVKVQGAKGMTSKTVQTNRILVTTENPSCVAKNRYGLPETIEMVEEGDDFIERAEKTWTNIGKLISAK